MWLIAIVSGPAPVERESGCPRWLDMEPRHQDAAASELSNRGLHQGSPNAHPLKLGTAGELGDDALEGFESDENVAGDDEAGRKSGRSAVKPSIK